MKLSRWYDPLGLFNVKPTKPTPPGDFTPTTVTEGGVTGVLFGTRNITPQYITFWGDIKTTAIKSKGGKK